MAHSCKLKKEQKQNFPHEGWAGGKLILEATIICTIFASF